MPSFRKAWQKIALAGAVSGIVSSLSILAGIPLDKEDLSLIFMSSVCTSISGAYKESCLAWAVLISLAVSILGLVYLVWNLKKIKRFLFLPGWSVGIILYAVFYFSAQAIVFYLLG